MEENYFTGKISHVRVFPYVLSPREINQLYLEERLLSINWFQRLMFWVRITWLLLRGKLHFER